MRLRVLDIMPDLAEALHFDDHLLWALIGVSIAMVFTLQAVQAAVEGAWPHERRPARLLPHERAAQPIWGLVALCLLVGGILLIINLTILLWKDLEFTEAQVIGSLLLGVCWVIFILVSFDRLSVRGYLTSIGPVAPMAVLVVMIVAILILTVSMLDIWPSQDEIRDEIPILDALMEIARRS